MEIKMNTQPVSQQEQSASATRSCRRPIMPGQKYGLLTVLESTQMRHRNSVMWKCICDCGKETYATSETLNKGTKRSCGCLRNQPHNYLDLTGKRYGSLTVLRKTDIRKNNFVVWECRCDCGNLYFATTQSLNAKGIRSCGCKNGPAYTDLTGQVFGDLTVRRIAGRNRKGRVLWQCECQCGNSIELTYQQLIQRKNLNCGCRKLVYSHDGYLNLIGQRFGAVTVIGPTAKRNNRSIVWECRCDCGNTIYLSTFNLKENPNRRCRCKTQQAIST